MDKKELGIYVHIPFCKRKCKYCDFVSFENHDEFFKKYIDKVIEEIDYCFQKESFKYNELNLGMLSQTKVNTIYFGGGTPSIINEKYIGQILEKIKEMFDICSDTEITIEINPGTISKEKLEYYKSIGINRLSIGLQSAENRLLSLIGRIHSYEEFLDAYKLARECGFENINVDLMLALPTQTVDELVQSLIKVINLSPEHISLYSLILEEGTKLEKEINEGKLFLVSDELERKMYWKSKKMLEKNKYAQYEISNFSKKGYESKHNMNCWNQNEYIGFGVAAHSYINDIRFSNECDFDKYLSESFDESFSINEKQTIEDKVKEYMMLGFRKMDGIRISKFEEKFGINPLLAFRFEIEKLVKQDLIEIDLDNIKLTQKGLDFANTVFEEFV